MIITSLASVASVNYFMPFIISSTIGIVSTIGCSVGFYYYGTSKSQQSKENSLRHELKERQNQLRESTTKLAEKTKTHTETILQQTENQQNLLDQKIQAFNDCILKIESTANKLSEEALRLNEIQSTPECMQSIEKLNTRIQKLSDMLRENTSTRTALSKFHFLSQLPSRPTSAESPDVENIIVRLTESLEKEMAENAFYREEIERLNREPIPEVRRITGVSYE